MSESRVLLLGDTSSDQIARVLGQRDRFLTRVEDPDEAIRAAPEHQIVVIDVVPPPRTVADVCRELRANAALAEVPVLAISATDDVESRIRLLEAGADDVMARPVDDRELDARVEALDLRYQRSKELRPSALVTSTRRGGRRLIVVFSPKGGVGTTTVAVNLALAIASREPERVAIVDLAATGGHVATQLDIKPRMMLSDLARDRMSVGDPDAIRTYLERHPRGLFVLAADLTPPRAVVLAGDNVTAILDTVLLATPTVIVDAGSYLDERAIAALELADNVVIVVTPEFPALKAVHAMLEHLHEVSSPMPEPTIVINELFDRQMLTTADIEAALGMRVHLRLPHEPRAFQRAVNEGLPVFGSAPSSPAGRRFDELAAVLLGEDAPQMAGERRRRGFGAMLGRS